MSTNRRGTWGPKGKGPNGRNLCYCGCGREVPKGCRTTFEPDCYQKWAAKHDPAAQRRLVAERDNGVCAICGVDTIERQRAIEQTKRLVHWLVRRHVADLSASGALEMFPGFNPSQERVAAQRIAEGQAKPGPMDEYLWTQHWVDEEIRNRFGAYAAVSGHTWEADHIVPVIEGGGECDLSNLRTLCLPCHRKVTAELARRRADQRRKQKQPELILS